MKSAVSVHRRLADNARCNLHILILQSSDDFRSCKILEGESARIEPDTHAVFPRPINIHISDSIEPLELLAHIENRVVADVELIVGIVRRNHVDDHEQIRRALQRGDAGAPHDVGKLRLGNGNPVLDEHLRLVEVGAGLKGDRERHRAIARALARHVEHVLHSVDLLLNRRRHRLGDDLRTRARIRGPHDDGRRSYLRILCQWKGLVGDGTNKNNQNGKDRGEDWAIDENLGKVHAATKSTFGRRSLFEPHGDSWPHSHQTARDDSILGR